jgi:hypothetical protein
MATTLIVNAATGDIVERELTAQEFASYLETPAQRLARLLAECTANRHGAYVAEADPLFFKWQRGEGTEQAWLDKVAEIRNRYPEPTNA